VQLQSAVCRFALIKHNLWWFRGSAFELWKFYQRFSRDYANCGLNVLLIDLIDGQQMDSWIKWDYSGLKRNRNYLICLANIQFSPMRKVAHLSWNF